MQHARCALLTFVLGIFFVTASCGDESVVPKSGAAGKVISAKGNVSASREGEAARTLNENDVVYVNDTLTTTLDSSITILLTHNGAHWTVEGEGTARLQESIAWRAAKQNASAFALREDLSTSVAAADSTKMAADTAATAKTTSAGPQVTTREQALPTPPGYPAATAGNVAAGASAPGGETEFSGAPLERGARAKKVRSKPTSTKSDPDALSEPKGRIDSLRIGKTQSGNGAGANATPAKTGSVRNAPKVDPSPPPPPPPPQEDSGPSTRRSLSLASPGAPSVKGSSKPKEDAKPETKKAEKQAATSALLRNAKSACLAKAAGKKGSFQYVLKVSSGRFVSFSTSKVSSGLQPLADCMRAKIKSSPLAAVQNKNGTITVP